MYSSSGLLVVHIWSDSSNENIKKALHDTFSYHGCSCEHDCWGCLSQNITQIKASIMLITCRFSKSQLPAAYNSSFPAYGDAYAHTLEVYNMKYELKWSGRKDSEVVQLAFAYCKKEIPICKDICEFINYDRYLELVTAGEIAPPTAYRSITEGQVGMIGYFNHAKQYPRSWENLDHCYKDFIAGHAACEAKYKLLRDWDEAIEHENKRNKYLKKCKRTISFNVEEWDSIIHPLYDPQASLVKTQGKRNGRWKFTVTDTCTGPEFGHLVYIICSDCRIPMPEIEIDPRRDETTRY